MFNWVCPRGLGALAGIVVGVLLVIATGLPMPARAQSEIAAVPASFSNGARIRVATERLAVSTNYRVRLEQARPGAAEFDLLNFNSGSSTQPSLTAAIPDAPLGNYALVLYRVQLGLTKVAETPVTVVAGPSISLTSDSARPGKSVRVQAGNLVAGSLRVIYSGSTILGPIPVAAGTWSGKFVVPRDRPPSLPAAVAVVVENLVGRVVVARATTTFQALASSGQPRLRLSQSGTPPTPVRPGRSFTLAGRLQTDEGLAPQGAQSAYWRDARGVVMPLDQTISLAADGAFTMSARAPSNFLDGYPLYQSERGRITFVNRGQDPHTDSPFDDLSTNDSPFEVEFVGRNPASAQFTVVVQGNQPGNNDPLLGGVFVEAQQQWRSDFGGAPDGSGVWNNPNGDGGGPVNDMQALGTSNPNQFRNTSSFINPYSSQTYGCSATIFRRQTNASGEATFTFRPEAIANTNISSFANDPCRYTSQNCRPAAPGGSGALSPDQTRFIMQIYSAHVGYRNDFVELAYDGAIGRVVDPNTGQPFPNDRVTVRLTPSEQADFDLRNLRIDNLGAPWRKVDSAQSPCPPGSGGECYLQPFTFGTMYTYPDGNKWPASVFNPLNQGRVMRLQVDPAVTGPMAVGRMRIHGGPWINFVPGQGTPACVFDQTTPIEYVAALPDLTRLPVAGVTTNHNTGVSSGGINGEVELRFGMTALRTIPIKIATELPPTGLDVTNPQVTMLRINGQRDSLTVEFNYGGIDIPVPPPGHGIGNMDNVSQNDGTFSVTRAPDNAVNTLPSSTSNNDVAGRAGGPQPASGVFFGFTNADHSTPDPVTLFDTGVIPLFRYVWGIPPLAAATLGADFWMRSELAFYGQLMSAGMNATIDPTVEGGVKIFFDLDVLLGLISASIAAETEIGLTMRSIINDGGLAHQGVTQQSGACFRFDLDAVWEACAAGICGGGREPLIEEREPDNCSTSSRDRLPLALRMPEPGGFDLARPFYTATALANDGRANSVTVGVTASGTLVATHLSGSSPVATRTIAAQTAGVQHIDVAYHATNRIVAVWSENTRTPLQLQDLIRSQRERAFDAIARTQRLRFSSFDGRVWSTPADLTAVGNDGKPQLAGCLPAPRLVGTSACPSGGEVTAVWERDANANLDNPDIEVWSSRWQSARGWTTPSRVSAAGASSDMLPSVAYRNATPIVVWAHNRSGHFVNLGGRQAAYRFLDGRSEPVIASALGSGVGWLSIGVSPADAVVIAYTLAQDPQGFVGNRQALFGARATSCDEAAGTCSFLVTQPRDGNGRQFRVERPRVEFDDEGTPIIGFRAVGFGPTTSGQVGLPGDMPGTLLGTDELGSVRVHSFAQPIYTAQFVPLSDNGLQHWKPDYAFDDVSGSLLVVSMQAQAPVNASGPMRFAKAVMGDIGERIAKGQSLNDGAVLRIVPSGPDFSLRDPQPSRSVVAAGQSLNLRLGLVNQGQAYDPATHGGLRVVVSWNGPAGVGDVAGQFELTDSQPANGGRNLTIPLTVPAGLRNDQRQTLFVDIVAGDEANTWVAPPIACW
jgi:hypothetical protein